MGVHGLWKFLEPSGQMVPLESLTGKIIAVDISIWLHQAIKGMHNTHGAPVGVAHLIILLHRLCKLLYYKIKPIFVFDGGVPALKHQTLAARRSHSNMAKTEALKVREKLIKNLLKHEAVRQILANETASAALGLNSFALPGPSVEEDLYKLPPIAADYEDSVSSEVGSESEDENEKYMENIHSIDVASQQFLNLPPEVRHDILTEMIETRKQSSWKYLDSMPKNLDNFSDFQMNRLLKRYAVQTSLDKAGKEMGGRALSIQELESMLADKGALSELPTKRIAQDNVTRYMLVQKISNSDTRTDSTKNNKTFDIMEHMDDVQWSSESDTEVIAGKPSNVVTKKSENCYKISGNFKEQITEDIANIVNILENGMENKKLRHAERKIIDIETNVMSGEDEMEKANRTLEEEEATRKQIETFKSDRNIKDVKKEEDNADLSHYKIAGEGRSNEIVNSDIKSIDKLEKGAVVCPTVGNINVDVEVVDVKEDFTEDRTTITNETKVDNFEPRPVKKAESEEKNKPKNSIFDTKLSTPPSTSSSDSESDFIPITPHDSNNISHEASDLLLVKKSEDEFQDMFITIRPSNIMNESEDLFADVFQSHQVHEVVKKEEREEENRCNPSIGSQIEIKDSVDSYRKECETEMSSGDLEDLKRSLDEKQYDLILEQNKHERKALNLTDQMYTDAQDLLRLFGIPFIIAPMEAEAQCATLNTLGLTEGTITEDSDIWLFGGQVVYKNFFNQTKHVLEYTSVNIQKCFKLSREDLIKMAMLVGSDYTTGLNGIGPVTALEILASFPSTNENLLEGLERFRDWFIGRCETTSPRHSLKRKIRNTVISPGFPNVAVAEAYLHPQVDDSKEPFSWAKPNLDLIRKYLKMKLGWSLDKCNNLLLPVIKKLEENTCQSIMEKYFKSVPKNVGILSKRVENAIKRLDGIEEPNVETSKPKRKRKTMKTNNSPGCSKTEEDNGGEPEEAKKTKINSAKKETLQIFGVGNQTSKEMLIKEKLHAREKIPQKEKAQKVQEERKKQAIEIYRMVRGKGKKKRKEFAKKEAKLSESSESD